MAEALDDGQVAQLAVQDYETVRTSLVSGDLFFCSGNYLVSKAIRQMTSSPWSHVGVVLVVQEIDRVLLLESVEDVGVRLAPVSKYLTDYENDQPYDGIVAFARTTAATPPVVKTVASFGCDELTRPYDKEEIARILARITLGLGRGFAETHSYICSELVFECFKQAGYEFAHGDDFVSPGDIWTDKSVSLVARVQ